MEKLNFGKQGLRRFGITIGTAFFIIGLILIIRHKYSLAPILSISVISIILAIMVPYLLKPFYIAWMRLAFLLSWVNTRIILFIIFYLIFTPIGTIMKVFRMDLLNRKIDKDKDSYWQKIDRKAFCRLNYERQF